MRVAAEYERTVPTSASRRRVEFARYHLHHTAQPQVVQVRDCIRSAGGSRTRSAPTPGATSRIGAQSQSVVCTRISVAARRGEARRAMRRQNAACVHVHTPTRANFLVYTSSPPTQRVQQSGSAATRPRKTAVRTEPWCNALVLWNFERAGSRRERSTAVK